MGFPRAQSDKSGAPAIKRRLLTTSYLACLLPNHFVRIFVFPDSEPLIPAASASCRKIEKGPSSTRILFNSTKREHKSFLLKSIPTSLPNFEVLAFVGWVFGVMDAFHNCFVAAQHPSSALKKSPTLPGNLAPRSSRSPGPGQLHCPQPPRYCFAE